MYLLLFFYRDRFLIPSLPASIHAQRSHSERRSDSMDHFPFGRLVKLRPKFKSYHRRNMREYIKKKGIFPKSRSRNPKGNKNRLANVSIAMIPGRSPMETENKGAGVGQDLIRETKSATIQPACKGKIILAQRRSEGLLTFQTRECLSFA